MVFGWFIVICHSSDKTLYHPSVHKLGHYGLDLVLVTLPSVLHLSVVTLDTGFRDVLNHFVNPRSGLKKLTKRHNLPIDMFK